MRALFVFVVASITSAAFTPTGAQQGDPTPRDRREVLEQRFRQRAAAVVQQRLGLSDAQMQRLGAVNADLEGHRRALQAQERDLRIGLRRELMRADSADQQRVARYMDELINVQRQRIDLLAREQQALAAFMTPVQRAQYLAIQEQMRRRMEEMRSRVERGGQRRRGNVPPAP